MDIKTLFALMQFGGGTFPSGSFSQSWGLETYTAHGRIMNGEQFEQFLNMYVDTVVGACEGPIAAESIWLSKEWDLQGLLELEALSCAVKLTRESRTSSTRSGKAFLRIAASIFNDDKLTDIFEMFSREGMTYPVAYGILCGRMGINREEALAAFVFNTVNALVQSGIKLVPLGNVQGQKILLDAGQLMSQAVRTSLATGIDEITNFAPGLDIASMVHETLPVRLFMT